MGDGCLSSALFGFLCVLEGSLDVRDSGKGYPCLSHLLLLPSLLFCGVISLSWKLSLERNSDIEAFTRQMKPA